MPLQTLKNNIEDKQLTEKLIRFDIFKKFEKSNLKNDSLYTQSILSSGHREKYTLSDSNETWKLTKKVAMKYNRIVFYPSFLIHNGIFQMELFDGPRDMRRLTQTVGSPFKMLLKITQSTP